jgi:hypothetical protein
MCHASTVIPQDPPADDDENNGGGGKTLLNHHSDSELSENSFEPKSTDH